VNDYQRPLEVYFLVRIPSAVAIQPFGKLKAGALYELSTTQVLRLGRGYPSLKS
jgi:hypothetical protein